MKIMKIGSVWCSGCLVMKPRWAEIEEANPWLETEFYDYDQSPEIVETYKINENLPVAIVVDDKGNELTRITGEVSKNEILKTIEAFRTK